MRFDFPYLPPSSNHAYVNKRGGGGRTLSTEGRAWKKDTAAYLGQKYGLTLPRFSTELPYIVVVTFHLQVFNETFGAKNGAKSRYKKRDTSNLWKLLADVLVPFLGIDDSQFTSEVLRKKNSAKEHTTVEVWEDKTEQLKTSDALVVMAEDLEHGG